MSRPISRRHFLRGAGGAVMAIPFLPSITTRAFAADPGPGTVSPCFLAMGTDHGAIWGANMYPDDAILTQTLDYAGREVRYGDLPATVDAAGNVSWSPCCTASGAKLSPALVKKFNVLRGLDIPYRIGHHTGGHLGNFAATADHRTGGIENGAYGAATIDQVMAWSKSFYGPVDLESKMTQRSFCVGNGRLSWNYTSPGNSKGQLVQQPSHLRNLDLFSFFFDPGSAYNGVDSFLVDRIKASYQMLRKHPRISSGDLLRLDQHVDQMAEVERKLKVGQALTDPPPAPTLDSKTYFVAPGFNKTPADNIAYCGLMNDVIVLAFQAGVSRVGSWYQSIKFTDTQINDWHGNVGHQGLGTDKAQTRALGWNQGTFAHVMVDLAEKMNNVTMSDGTTLLDNSLLMFSQEAGQLTHHDACVNTPIVMAGGAGGFFKTGMYVDFSDQATVLTDLAAVAADNDKIQLESPGLYYNQLLATAMQSMGLAPADYEIFKEYTKDGPAQSDPVKGFGFHYVDPKWAEHYTLAKLVIGDKLPVIT